MGLENGLFITFEGGEGSGKSTQVKLLAQRLGAAGHDVVLTREPGGTPEAEKIRDLLVRGDGCDWDANEEALLLFAARANHVRLRIKPALAQGKIVISDRFTDSTRAYQGYGFAYGLDKVEQLNHFVLGDFAPDLTFLLDIPARDGLARSNRRLTQEQSGEDRYERLDVAFHERLRAGFLEIAGYEPDRFRVIDAQCAVDEIADKVAQFALERLVGR